MTCDQDLKEKMEISIKFVVSMSMIIVFNIMKLLVATFIIKLFARIKVFKKV